MTELLTAGILYLITLPHMAEVMAEYLILLVVMVVLAEAVVELMRQV